MRRREFLGLAGSTLASWPLATYAQEQVRRIGALTNLRPVPCWQLVSCAAVHWKCLMTKLVAAVALASIIGSSALAQSYDPSVGSGNLNTTGHEGAAHAPTRRVGELQCDFDMDCRRQELVDPPIPRLRNKRSPGTFIRR